MKNKRIIHSIFTKSLLLIILSLNFTFKTFAQKKTNKNFVISIEIKNYKKKYISLVGFKFDEKIRFNKKKNSFLISSKKIKKGNYNLTVGKKHLDIYIDAKNDLFIELDGSDWNTRPIFKGNKELVNINNYLHKKQEVFSMILHNDSALFISKEKLFIKKIDMYRHVTKKLLLKSKLPKLFKEIEKKDIYYIYLMKLKNYETYHRMIIGDDSFKASLKVSNKLKNYSLNIQKLYIFSSNYRTFISEIITNEISGKSKKINKYSLDIINKLITNNFIKDEFLYKVAISNITQVQDFSSFYKKYISYCSNNKYRKTIAKIYTKLKRLEKGNPSPKFNNYKNSNGTKTSLDDLINKGKYIYIDVWATWCGFCIKEFPVLDKISHKYRNANIRFVGINVDSKENYKKWEKTVISQKMKDLQLFAGQEIEKLNFAKQYLIDGLPRYILLAPDGTIINHNAPRPSDGSKLDKLFKNLGIKPN